MLQMFRQMEKNELLFLKLVDELKQIKAWLIKMKLSKTKRSIDSTKMAKSIEHSPILEGFILEEIWNGYVWIKLGIILPYIIELHYTCLCVILARQLISYYLYHFG